ncbi:unnamed protein product [Cochlearia groenlandica]
MVRLLRGHWTRDGDGNYEHVTEHVTEVERYVVEVKLRQATRLWGAAVWWYVSGGIILTQGKVWTKDEIFEVIKVECNCGYRRESYNFTTDDDILVPSISGGDADFIQEEG